MTTLITGGGFVGSMVAAELLSRGASKPILFDVAFSMDNLQDRLDLDAVQLVRGDVTELSELLATIQANDVDCIIHTAALLHAGVSRQVTTGVKVNVMGTLAVLEAARLCSVPRVVNCSAASVILGRKYPAGTPVVENVALGVVDDYPPNIYSTAKLTSEWLCQNYRDTYGLSTVSIRAAGTFGPWLGESRGHPAGLLRKIVEGGWRDGVVRLPPSDLRQSIDFVYSNDVARGLVLAAVHPNPPSPVYNISMGVSHSVTEIVRILSDFLGREVSLEATDETSQAMFADPAPSFDISLAERELGYTPAFPMPEAIRDYVGWMATHLSQ